MRGEIGAGVSAAALFAAQRGAGEDQADGDEAVDAPEIRSERAKAEVPCWFIPLSLWGSGRSRQAGLIRRNPAPGRGEKRGGCTRHSGDYLTFVLLMMENGRGAG